MSITNILTETLPDSLKNLTVIRWLVFSGVLMLALLLGHLAPGILRIVFRRIAPDRGDRVYREVAMPIESAIRTAVTFILVSWIWVWLKRYDELYEFSRPLLDLGVAISFAWLISRLIHQLLRFYGLSLIKRLRLADEVLLAVEMAANITIGILAALTFAQMRGLNLITAIAGFGLIGGGITLAAQRIIEQLLSAVVLYLDRPFVPGDYIRMTNGELGKVETIGFRSTRIRALAKNTLFVYPNSILVTTEVENVSRGKKVVVMLQLNFEKILKPHERALVVREAKNSTASLLGIDAANTNVAIEDQPDGNTQARLVFFILGSHENSLDFRKRLLSVANDRIATVLARHDLAFTTNEPTIYVDAPMTI
jgi:small-conductance mechanosensitive channel